MQNGIRFEKQLISSSVFVEWQLATVASRFDHNCRGANGPSDWLRNAFA